MKQQFQAAVTGRGPKGAWVQVDIPFPVAKVFGRKGMVPVAGTVNGFPFRSSLKPNGDGTHYLHLNQELLAGAQAQVGDTVTVMLTEDQAPRTVTLPEDLQSALAAAPQVAEGFHRLSYSHQKEFVTWITQARKPETRAGRVAKTLEMVAAKQTPKG